MQGLMWRATGVDGTLTYSFVEAVKATYPFYVIRMLGGLCFLSGMCLMAWNTWITVKGQPKVNPIVYKRSPDPIDSAMLGPASATAATTGTNLRGFPSNSHTSLHSRMAASAVPKIAVMPNDA